MEIKSVKPIKLLTYSATTTVNELHQYLSVGQNLFKEAVHLNLPITGPVHWHYFGFDGDPTKSFQLEVALPVANLFDNYSGEFKFKRTEVFKCLSLIHEGGWLQIPSSYQKAFAYLNEHHLSPSFTNREIYINVDFENPESNVTEIQIGIN